MKRLYLRIYLIVIASLALFMLLVALGWFFFDGQNERSEWRTILAEAVAELVPHEASAEANQRVLQRWHERLGVQLALFDGEGRLSAQAGSFDRPPTPADFKFDDHRRSGRWRQPWLALPDGRFVGVGEGDSRYAWERPGRGEGFAGLLGFLALIGVAVALAAWWPARQMTRRLEALQAAVDAFGSGDLEARSPVRGRDEIAKLATHFNESADRVSTLLRSQRSLLANASHELRSPLARIRMAVELDSKRGLSDDERIGIQGELQRNVAELDALVEELLTASRLEAADTTTHVSESIDLTGLVAEECARLNIEPTLASLEITGDARLLRRLIRNLLENACRYGGSMQDIEVSLVRQDRPNELPLIVLAVCDRGPGIAADERERIFEPFYRARGSSEKSGGVGLGLSLVRQIAQHHGGQIRCVARRGGGTCFEATLPGQVF